MTWKARAGLKPPGLAKCFIPGMVNAATWTDATIDRP